MAMKPTKNAAAAPIHNTEAAAEVLDASIESPGAKTPEELNRVLAMEIEKLTDANMRYRNLLSSSRDVITQLTDEVNRLTPQAEAYRLIRSLDAKMSTGSAAVARGDNSGWLLWQLNAVVNGEDSEND